MPVDTEIDQEHPGMEPPGLEEQIARVLESREGSKGARFL